MNFRTRAKPETMGFQMAPMIDVVFLLLCFFVASQIFAQWEAEIDITLPTARTSEIPRRLPGEVILNIRANGDVVVNGRSLQSAELGTMLKRLAQLFPGQPVLIRADKSVAYQHVISVLDLCRQADIWNISFATAMPET
ncbi:MAG: biopolymer transporter ExbD [Kiritimatiellae bacterium]|nr:biopolymer transporter ExbD [Kiritimatiellia bacterium]MDW8458658.1 biopolymer transporter ExbD [Verrucomicrobiota bacterium]